MCHVAHHITGVLLVTDAFLDHFLQTDPHFLEIPAKLTDLIGRVDTYRSIQIAGTDLHGGDLQDI